MHFKKTHIIAVAFLLFSFLLRFALISKGPYHGDTISLIIQAEKTLETLHLQKQSPLGFPLIVILASLSIFISRIFSLNNTAMAVNFISVVFSSLAVFAFYFLILELFTPDKNTNCQKKNIQKARLIATISAILLSISPIFLGISVYGKSHAPCLFFLLAGMRFLLKFLKTSTPKFFILSALFLGLMGATRILDLFLMSLPLSVLYFFAKNIPTEKINILKKLKSFVLWWISIISITSLCYLPYLFQGEMNSFSSDLIRYMQHAFAENYIGLFSGRLWIVIKYLLKNFSILSFLLSLAGFIVLYKKNLFLFIFLILWILSPVLYYGNLYMTVTSRYFVIVLPPITIAIAYGIVSFMQKNIISKITVLIILFILQITMLKTIYPLLKIRHDYAITPSFAKWVEKNTPPNARIIHPDGSAFLPYYGNRQTAYRPLSADKATKEELNTFREKTDTLLNQNIDLYINSIGLYTYNTENHFSNFFHKHYVGKEVGTHYYEDWHSGAMEMTIVPVTLYKIEKRKRTEE